VIDQGLQRLFVADRENARIQAFDMFGNFKGELQLPRKWHIYAICLFAGQMVALVWPQGGSSVPPFLMEFKWPESAEGGRYGQQSGSTGRVGSRIQPSDGVELDRLPNELRILHVPYTSIPHDLHVLSGWKRGDFTKMQLFVGETRHHGNSYLQMVRPPKYVEQVEQVEIQRPAVNKKHLHNHKIRPRFQTHHG